MAVIGSPANPLPPGAQGQAMAMAAWAMHTLGAWPVRLVWCVDLARDVGPDADEVHDPSHATDPPTTLWGTYLTRFRDALDRQEWGGGTKAHIALTVRYTSAASGKRLEITFDLPWTVCLATVARARPPVGVWRLVWEPQRKVHPIYGHRADYMPFEGDSLPSTFFYDGIPF